MTRFIPLLTLSASLAAIDVSDSLSPIVPAVLTLMLAIVTLMLFVRTRELTLIPIALSALCLMVDYAAYEFVGFDLAVLSAYSRPLWSMLVLILILHFWIRYLTATRRSVNNAPDFLDPLPHGYKTP